MRKMATQVDAIVNAYKTLAKIPAICSGRLNNAANRVTARWTVRNLDKGKNTSYLYSYHLDDNFNVTTESEFGLDVSKEISASVSPNETFRAVIREDKDAKDLKKQYLEVWKANRLTHSIDLTALDMHGDVYADSGVSGPFWVVPAEFGCLSWSPDESSVLYVAEKKLPKTEPYIKRKPAKEDGSGETPVLRGEEHIYRQDWGEQLVGKHLSVIVVCRLDTETLTVLEGLPETWFPGQVRFAKDGKSVVGVCWETEPRRLGLMFCTNRPSHIFHLTLDGELKKLTPNCVAVRSPRVNADGELYWLQRGAGGPHHSGHQLMHAVDQTSEPKVLIDLVETVTKISNDASFYGIYCHALPNRCFSKDGRVLFSTPQRTEARSYVYDKDTNRLVDITNSEFYGSTIILDVSNDVVLASCSSQTTPAQLYVARLPAKDKESDIKWVRISEVIEVPEAVKTAFNESLLLEHADTQDSVKHFSAIFLSPKSDKKTPLVLHPHGGPHTTYINSFSLEIALYMVLGWSTMQVNYRGSVGDGEKTVNFLHKRVGTADVVDCKMAADIALERYNIDEKNIFLNGGSHGGFLVAQLSGQYPDFFRAVSTRNPVIDIASMINSTDIGMSSLRINFRGSTGHGEANCRSLLANVGVNDVKDCLLALSHVTERDNNIDVNNVFIHGGSYGGFLAAHLAGQRPELFRAVVMRNPVIDWASKFNYADNPDGCAVECGFSYKEQGPVCEEELLAMRRCSPLAHVHKVKAPTALLLGVNDKRVPVFQGLEYYWRLKANGVPVKVFLYNDNHSLSSMAHEIDGVINGAKWFTEHLKQ